LAGTGIVVVWYMVGMGMQQVWFFAGYKWLYPDLTHAVNQCIPVGPILCNSLAAAPGQGWLSFGVGETGWLSVKILGYRMRVRL